MAYPVALDGGFARAAGVPSVEETRMTRNETRMTRDETHLPWDETCLTRDDGQRG